MHNWGSDNDWGYAGERGKNVYIDYGDDASVCSYDVDDDDPVIISFPFPFKDDNPQSVITEKRASCPIEIANTASEPIDLWGVKIYGSNPADSFTLSLMQPPENKLAKNSQWFVEGYTLEDRVLQPKQKLTIWLSCTPKETGMHTTLVLFDVGSDRIERVAFLLAEDAISLSLAANKEYSKPQRRQQFSVEECVSSSSPYTRKGGGKPKNSLPFYDIPKDMRSKVENNIFPPCLSEGLMRDNYNDFFSTLLIMEELHLEKEMSYFSMVDMRVKKKGTELLALEVPGLAEKRPSLIHGDIVYFKSALAKSSRPYKGEVVRVEADEVLLRFPSELTNSHKKHDTYDVQFAYNRTSMRRLYQAVEMVERIDRDFVFPSSSCSVRSIESVDFTPISGNMNSEQRDAVSMILGCKGAPPYVIFGPPGTGKTKTMVEAILQLYSANDASRILVCAASNSAADHVLEKLVSNDKVNVKDNKIFRLNAVSRPYSDVHLDHIKFCYLSDSVFKCPPLKALLKYRIIVSTYMSALSLHAEGLERGFFSHIFLDESGQASEPECMVPIANFCRKETVVVLAGDPQQLGPVVFSKDADRFGLGKSFLVRLFEFEPYRVEDKNYVTKLVKNYRCHPAILDLPSKLFYGGELLPCKEDGYLFGDAELGFLHNNDFPVVFYGVQGMDEREGTNPSWFNRIEASKVAEIVRCITENGLAEESEIGVITPYRQQVAKIKKALGNFDVGGAKVGSVEQFQGQEREVIIVSTVRSTVKHNDFDRIYSLGFLSNPKRFNVAITRAKSLLVVVGNPHIVRRDVYWDKLLWYCVENGSYHGCPLPERDDCVDHHDCY